MNDGHFKGVKMSKNLTKHIPTVLWVA